MITFESSFTSSSPSTMIGLEFGWAIGPSLIYAYVGDTTAGAPPSCSVCSAFSNGRVDG